MANINKELNQIKNAVYGKDVRGSIHDGIDKINKETEKTTDLSKDTERRQASVEQQFDDLQQNATEISPSDIEIVAARTNNETGESYPTLVKRLNDENKRLTQQLAENEQEIDSVFIRLDEKRDKAQQTDLDEMTPRTLAAIQNKEGETTFNLLSIPRPYSVDRYKFDKAVLSPNLFDSSTVLYGKFIAEDGSLIDSEPYKTSDFIEVVPDTNYASKGIRIIAYYDEDKELIERVNPFEGNHIKQEFNTPLNAKYVRFSFYGTAAEDGVDDKVFAKESDWKWGFIPRTFSLEELQITKENLNNFEVLKNIKQTSNIFNPYSVKRGKDVSRSIGILSDNPNRNTSDFIKIKPSVKYFIARVLNVVFYDAQQVRFHALDLSDNPVNRVVGTPEGAEYMRVSFYSGEETIFNVQMVVESDIVIDEFIPFGFYLNDLRVSEKNLDFNSISPQEKVVRTEGIRWAAGYYWSDLTFVGNELWAFGPSDDAQAVSEGVGALYIFEDNDALTYKKTLYHDFGHVNTIDYNEITDSLIFGNGSGKYNTDGEMYIIQGVKYWKDFSKETMIELDNLPVGSRLIKFEFGRDFGDKVNVYWGENNLGQHNICYVASNDAANFRRLLLGKGTNQFSKGNFISGLSEGEFNGTYEILKEWSTNSLEVIQGARYYNGYHYLGLGHHGLWLEKYKLHEDGSVTSEGKREMAYKADGSTYEFFASEGVEIREGMIYHGTMGNSDVKAIHRYRVF